MMEEADRETETEYPQIAKIKVVLQDTAVSLAGFGLHFEWIEHEDRQQIVPTGWDSDEDDYPLGYSPTYIPHPDDETDYPVTQPQTETGWRFFQF